MVQRKMSVATGLKAASTVGAWIAVAALLAACGQKGPLMLPSAATPVSVATPSAASAASAP
ncbi:MAG: lipoprotein [Burkholderiales bacterium]|nr:lipoprotein [Burkholderiales bacterium]MDE2299435.1 lipoprotein [Burkholderiales bacterium]MDE2627560.1 lipoprotein [Burkholderiales bacterium]